MAVQNITNRPNQLGLVHNTNHAKTDLLIISKAYPASLKLLSHKLNHTILLLY